MKEEWNAGYEKGRDDYCCNHNCNQGRDCPLRKVELTDEEIDDTYKKLWDYHLGEKQLITDFRIFARAILRKAQEK